MKDKTIYPAEPRKTGLGKSPFKPNRGTKPTGFGSVAKNIIELEAKLDTILFFNPAQENRDSSGRFPVVAEYGPSFRRAQRMITPARRVGEVAQDLADIKNGVKKDPRKKRFYEKAWFHNTLIAGAAGAGILAQRHHHKKYHPDKPYAGL